MPVIEKDFFRVVLFCCLIFALVTFTGCSSDSGDTSDGDLDSIEGENEFTDEDQTEAESQSETEDDNKIDSLSNGLQIIQNDNGDFVFTLDNRQLLVLPESASLASREIDEKVESSYGQWRFTRNDEKETSYSYVDGSLVFSEDKFSLQYSSEKNETVEMEVSTVDDSTSRVTFSFSQDKANSRAVAFRCMEGATFHGFGEQYNATNQRGEKFRLFVSEQGIGRDDSLTGGALWMLTGNSHTTYFPMPYYLDAKNGYGVLFETDYRSYADICNTNEEFAWFEIMSDEPISLLLFHGPKPLDVIEQLGKAVGRPATPPDWAFSPWICSQGGKDAVYAQIDLLEQNDIPFSALWVQDWCGIRTNMDGGSGVEYRWEHDDELYPDLKQMIADIHSKGYKVLAYANPFVQKELDNHFAEMDQEGFLIKDPEASATYEFTSPAGVASHPDFTNAETVEYVQNALSLMVSDLGIDGWMNDFAEYQPLDATMSDGSNPRAYHNRFPIEWMRMAREVMDKERPDGDWVIFSRSGWTGIQSVAQIHWVGDQEATWSKTDGLPTVVPAMLNLGISGQPFVTHDIAGFSGGPSTKELFMRWAELGAFTPVMRTHDGNKKNENWSWKKDEDTISHFRKFAKIHELLKPEFIDLAQTAKETSAPIIRHLMLVFPDDPQTYNISDQFMIGDNLLVAPITDEDKIKRFVYFPEGEWYNIWTGEKQEGNSTVEIDAPLGQPAVFSRNEDRSDLRAIK